MSTIKIAVLVLAIAVALFMIFPNLSWAAEDGASLYKAKCTACHGVEGASPRRHSVAVLSASE